MCYLPCATNLKEETLSKMKRHNKTIDDIWWIGSQDMVISTERFFELSDTMYDSSHYTSQEVAYDLIIVFKDYSMMYRAEDGGEEWWQYISPLPPMTQEVHVNALTAIQAGYRYGLSLGEMNTERN